jgi:polar amino acid transport system substrate-binding protein
MTSRWSCRWLLLGFALLSAGSGASAEDQLQAVRRAGELVVGTEMQFAPFDFIDNGEERGFNRDFFVELGRDLKLRVRTIDLPWPSVLPGLEAGKFDIVSGPLMVTEARKAHYRFTLPIADGSVALLKRANDSRINANADIAGHIVGGAKGSAQTEQLKAYVATLPGVTTVREYIDNNQAYADLAAGRIVAVANSLPNIAYVASQRPDTFSVVRPTFGAPIDFAYLGRSDPSSKTLIDAIDADIMAMRADGRLAALQKKWFGSVMQTPGMRDTGARAPDVVLLLGLLVEAARTTVLISLIALCAGFVIGVALCSARLSGNAWLAGASGLYVGFFRGVPLIVQLLLVYNCLPFLGINVAPLVAAALAVTLCEAAYLAEILRGGFLGIARGQLEAARLLGLPWFDTLWRIQVPQALRLTLPSLVSEAIMLVKASSLISVVGVADITRTAQNIAASTFRPLTAYAAAGVVYLVINGALSLAGHGVLRRRQLSRASA